MLLLQYYLKFLQIDKYVDFISADNELSEDCQIRVISCPKWPSLGQPVYLQASRALKTLSWEHLARKDATSCICIGVLASLALVAVRAAGVYNAVCMIDAVDIDNSVGAISALEHY